MSFSDLLTSAKGPGVIGMIMALIVVLGFGLLFMFAFDDGLQGGGPTLAGAIRTNDRAIADTKLQIEAGEARLTRIPALKETADKNRTELTSIGLLEKQIQDRKSAIETTTTAIAENMEVFESYKNRYRAYIRASPKNRNLDELATNDGTIYRQVDIRQVTAVGIEIRHAGGQKRIPYEELPNEMQDYYQFDEDQKLAEIQREAAERGQHDAAVAIANQAADKMLAQQRARDQEAARQRRIENIASGKARLTLIADEIRRLENEVTAAENQAAAARAAGRRHLSRVGPLRGQLSQKRAELTQVQSELARLQALP